MPQSRRSRTRSLCTSHRLTAPSWKSALFFCPSHVEPPLLYSISPTWQRDRQVRLSTLWPSFRPTKRRYWRRWMRRTVWPPKLLRSFAGLQTWPFILLSIRALGRSITGLVAAERHLWLNLTEIREQKKAFLLDAPISSSGLFGDAVNTAVDKLRAAKTQAGRFKTLEQAPHSGFFRSVLICVSGRGELPPPRWIATDR